MTWLRKHKVLAFILGFVLAGAAGAAAAWFYGPYNGAVGGHVGTPSQIGSLTLTPTYNGAGLTPSSTSDATFSVSNPNSMPVTITTVTPGAFFMEANPPCNGPTAIHFNGSALVGQTFPPGTSSATIPNAWSADADLDPNCQEATFSIALSGTTNAG